jgi:hypothetical protein
MMPPLPPEYFHSTSGGGSFSYSSTGASVTSVLDTKASGEYELARSLERGIQRTKEARWEIEACLESPKMILFWTWAIGFGLLTIITIYKNGGFKWLSQ